MDEINNKIKEIKIENIVIYIYFILLIVYLYANKVEINYLYFKNELDKEKYKNLLYIFFGISLIISLLFAINNIKELYEYEENIEVYKLKKLSALSGILIVITTIIYLYIIYKDENINLEINP